MKNFSDKILLALLAAALVAMFYFAFRVASVKAATPISMPSVIRAYEDKQNGVVCYYMTSSKAFSVGEKDNVAISCVKVQ